MTFTTVWLRARLFRSGFDGLSTAGISNLPPRGVSGKEDRQEIVDSVVRSIREERQEAVVYDDSV